MDHKTRIYQGERTKWWFTDCPCGWNVHCKSKTQMEARRREHEDFQGD